MNNSNDKLNLSAEISPRSKTEAALKFGMALSLVAGVVLLGVKVYAYILTGSLAIFSDASESIVHLLAVAFSAYSLYLSLKPADENHPYGHDRIAFFSAGFEGAAIILAACMIIYESLKKWFIGLELEHIDDGILFIAAAVLINGGLGLYLIRLGKRSHSLIIKANGMHLLTDCWTSIAVLIALFLVHITGILIFDPIVALLAAGNILWTGSKLIKSSVFGLMDTQDQLLHSSLRTTLDKITPTLNVSYHALRHRMTGSRVLIEFHLLFPEKTSLSDAHEKATEIESAIKETLSIPCEILTHLEPSESHDVIHQRYRTGY